MQILHPKSRKVYQKFSLYFEILNFTSIKDGNLKISTCTFANFHMLFSTVLMVFQNKSYTFKSIRTLKKFDLVYCFKGQEFEP